MISRRQFVQGSALALAGCSAFREDTAGLYQSGEKEYPFRLGVASGDPTSDGVILWTRLVPEPLNDTSLSVPETVSWLIARDSDLKDVVHAGTTIALPEDAHCVHIDVSNLESDSFYYYQFKTHRFESPVGRTRTLPAPGVVLSEFSIGLTSCQEYSQGYFSAFKDLITKQPNVVIHNGDYIYEAPSGTFRPYPVENEARTLSEYRSLYAQYRLDDDLRDAHAQFPWFIIWDDHEVVNDWGPGHYLPSSRNQHLSLREHQIRKRAATKAFLEHMPLRASLARKDDEQPKLYGRNVIGDLLEINHLDVRSFRDLPACNEESGMRFVDCEDAHAVGRSMLGEAQEQWFYDSYGDSGCRWNCISQTTIMAALDRAAGPGVSFETDSWDNYSANRARILDHISRNNIRNPVSLGGNIHAFYAGIVSAEHKLAQCDPVLTELVTTSITATGGDIERFQDIQGRREENPCIEFFENRYHGYTFLQFTKERITATLRMVDDIESKNAAFSTLATLVVDDGQLGVTITEVDKLRHVA